MYSNLKALLLAIYLLAIVSACGVALPGGIWLQKVAVILVALHVLEMAIAFDSIKRHPGPLVDSMALTLLFGFLHWLPLRKPA
ncbi:MAG: hypothetical protein U1F09_06520 [Steroidobacteraceae bacterium]